MDVGSERNGVFRRWLTHWLTCVAVTILFVTLLQFIEGSSLLQTLDRLGADAVMHLHVPETAPHKVIVVDVGTEPKTADVTRALDKLMGAGVEALGLDLIAAKDLPPEPLTDLVGHLQQLSSENFPIAIPMVNPVVAEQVEGLRKIRRASVELSKDIDGIVRSARQHDCGEVDGHAARLPTLAWAVVAPHSEETQLGCFEPDHELPILYVPVISLPNLPPPNAPARKGILLMTIDMIDKNKELFEGA